MVYQLADLPLNALIGPLARADDVLARLDERVQKSPLRNGFLQRQHFADAVAALWLEGELVHVEDLVLHDAHMDIRTPTHELTRAHAVLRTRRRILGQKPDWALSRAGLFVLRGREGEGGRNGSSSGRVDGGPGTAAEAAKRDSDAGEGALAEEAGQNDALTQELSEIDALLARSSRLLAGEGFFAPSPADGQEPDAAGQGKKARDVADARSENLGPLIRDLDWDEDQRLAEWLDVVEQARREATPTVLAAAIAWEAWETIEPLQHQHWLGKLLVAALLREAGKVASHLFCLNAGLRIIPRERRKSPVRNTRLLAFLDAIAEGASLGLKEIDRLAMTKNQMERRLRSKRKSSSLPALIELVLARPVVSAGLVAKELQVTRRAALDLIAELGIREVTGRGRYRAWGVL
jgi:Protein of unknown function (DUF1612)/HTH DNA binding domain